jgi:hypothetical protein
MQEVKMTFQFAKGTEEESVRMASLDVQLSMATYVITDTPRGVKDSAPMATTAQMDVAKEETVSYYIQSCADIHYNIRCVPTSVASLLTYEEQEDTDLVNNKMSMIESIETMMTDSTTKTTTKEITPTTKETIQTTKETIQTTKETIQTTKETIQTTKETTQTTKETTPTMTMSQGTVNM